MRSEDTVLNPFVVITPRNKLSAYRLWASVPRYRLRSIWICKPVYLKKENIQSAEIANSIWTIHMENEDYQEIIIHAHQDEVQGGFELQGPKPTPLLKLLKFYFFRSPSLWTVVIALLVVSGSVRMSAFYQSEEFLNQYPLYAAYPQHFLSLVKTRVVFWGLMVPLIATPMMIAALGLSGFWKSKIGRIQAAIKVESWILLVIFFLSLIQFPVVKFSKNKELLLLPLNHSKIEEYIKALPPAEVVPHTEPTDPAEPTNPDHSAATPSE